MTLVLIDSYDYLPNGDITGVLEAQSWTGAPYALRADNGGTDTAFAHGKAMRPNGLNNSNVYYRGARGRQTDPMVWGNRFWVPPTTTGENYMWGVIDSQTTPVRTQWELGFDSFGCIYFSNYVNGARTLIAKTPSYTFYPGRWFYLEIKWTPSYTTGSFEVRVNTVPVLSLPSVRTADGTLVLPATDPGFDLMKLTVIRAGGSGTDANLYSWDDTYLLTQTGPQNNDYLGNVRAKYMAPVGNSSPLQWTIGGSSPAATNWQSVLNTALDDTKYVYASTVGYQDLYSIDPNLNTPQVFGIEVSGAYRQDDATQRWVKNNIKSSGVMATGTAVAINQSYTFYPDIYEIDPSTGVAFSGADVNALLIGPEVDT